MGQRRIEPTTGLVYWTYHDSSRPTIVMIHGFTGDHHGFQYIIPQLSDYHVIVPDLPGFGESQHDPKHDTVDGIAAKTNQFVRSLKLAKAPYLMSHSMGGIIAASMLHQDAKLYHQKTVFLTPASTPIGRLDLRAPGSVLGSLQYFIGKTIPRLGPALVTSKLISRAASRLMMTTKDPALRQRIFQHHIDNFNHLSSIEFYYRLHREIIKTGAIDYAESVKQHDVLVIAGDVDNVTPRPTVEKFARSIGGQLHVIDGVGHLMHYEKPREISVAVREFLY